MKRLVLYITFLVLCSHSFGQSLEALQKQKADAEKAIRFTNKLLEANKKTTQSRLNRLTLINRQIASRRSLLQSMNKEIQLLDKQMADISSNTVMLEKEIETLKAQYAKSVYQTWKTKSVSNRLMYVFSGQDLGMVYRRLRYLREFTSYRQSQGLKLLEKKDLLAKEFEELQNVKASKQALISSKVKEQQNLEQEQEKQSAYVQELKSKEKDLRKQLVQNQKKMNELNKFIEKIIAEDIRKSAQGKDKTKMALTPAEKLISESFDKNKGGLPWPLEQGVITSKFGVFSNPLYKNVKEENFGIDIQTLKGMTARAVFKGEVTGVYAVPGLNQVVIVRHGNYRTTYSNLQEVYVKRGDMLDTKQVIGKIFTDEVNNKTSLHFQVWKGTERLNPEQWISK